MATFQKILACVDFSDYSPEVLDYSLTLAKMFKAKIVAFNVINKRDVDAVATASRYYPHMVSVKQFLEKAREERTTKMHTMLEEMDGAELIDVEIAIEAGVPFEVILQAVDTYHIDLVVLANKGRGDLARTLLGSNAEKVFRHCPVPVLNVRNPKRFGRKI